MAGEHADEWQAKALEAFNRIDVDNNDSLSKARLTPPHIHTTRAMLEQQQKRRDPRCALPKLYGGTLATIARDGYGHHPAVAAAWAGIVLATPHPCLLHALNKLSFIPLLCLLAG